MRQCLLIFELLIVLLILLTFLPALGLSFMHSTPPRFFFHPATVLYYIAGSSYKAWISLNTIFALTPRLHRFLMYDRISVGFPSYFLYMSYIFYSSVQRVHVFKPKLGDVNLVVHVQTWYQRVGIEMMQINMHE